MYVAKHSGKFYFAKTAQNARFKRSTNANQRGNRCGSVGGGDKDVPYPWGLENSIEDDFKRQGCGEGPNVK